MQAKLLAALVAASPFAVAQQTWSIYDAPVVAVDGWSRIDELVDLDLDGDLDGAGLYFNQVTSSTQPAFLQMKLHRNDGRGRLTSSILYSWSTTPGQPTQYRSAVGDVDGDGNDDLVTLVGSTLWIVESRPGQPTVRTLSSFTLSFQYASAAQMIDVNGDGRDELITCDTFDGLRVFSLAGPTLTRRAIASPTQGSTELVVLDADGNGQPDAAILYGAQLVFLPLAGLGALTPMGSLTLPNGISSYGNLAHLTAGDIDGDGDTDLVAFSGSGQYVVVERVGPAQYSMHAPATGGPATQLSDFDGDGDLDGCCCGGGGGPTTTSPNTQLGNFEIAENLGNGVFAPAWRMPSIGPFHLAGCADLDGDGRNDLAGGRCVYFGHGRMSNPVAPVMTVAPAMPPFDLERDGDPDVVDGLAGNWRNNGSGALANAGPILPGLPAGESWAALQGGCLDFDHDGDVDLLANHLASGVPTGTHLLRNAGGGHFVDAGPITSGQTIQSSDPPYLADLDGDSDEDLVAVDGVVLSQIWWRQANGMFLPGTPWPDTRVFAVADFTGDGAPDLLSGDFPFLPAVSITNLTVLRSLGNGTFSPQPVGQQYMYLRFGLVDYEGDGDLDLVGFHYTGVSSLAFYLNDGLGYFALGPLVTNVTIAPGGRIEVADVDRDGRWDVVAGPAGYPDALATAQAGVWVIRQVAPQQFVPVLYSTDFGWPVDLDGDGDLDLLGSRLMRNVVRDGAAAGQREQFGVAVAGTGGATPTLGATGPFRVGSTLQTTITGGPGGALAVLLGSFGRTELPGFPVPGMTLYVQGPVTLAVLVLNGALGAPGQGSGGIPTNLPASAAGVEIFEQALLLDPQGAAPGITQTQGLRLRFGW